MRDRLLIVKLGAALWAAQSVTFSANFFIKKNLGAIIILTVVRIS